MQSLFPFETIPPAQIIRCLVKNSTLILIKLAAKSTESNQENKNLLFINTS